MAGLFDFASDNAGPLLQGLLGGVGGALASRGNRAQAIGSGLLGAVGGYSGGQQDALASSYRNSQMAAQKMAIENAQNKKNYLNSVYSTPPSLVASNGPTQGAIQQSTGPTWAGLLQAGFSPDEAQKILSRGGPKAKDFEIGDVTGDSYARYLESGNPADLQAARKMEIAANGVAYNPYEVQSGTAFNDPNAAFMINAQGQIVPNTPAQQFALRKASAGASRTNVRVENKMGESLAGQIGPMMKEALSDADSAVKGMDAANRIQTALNSGNVFSGKLGNAGLTVAQWKDALNMTGPDEKAALANTRSMMQGLAQLTLQGRQQMRGQGQITEGEGKLAERVSSGDFTLTPAELSTLAGAAQRTSQYMYGNYQKRFNALRGNENYAPMAPYYEAPALPGVVAPQAVQPAGPAVDDLLNKYR